MITQSLIQVLDKTGAAETDEEVAQVTLPKTVSEGKLRLELWILLDGRSSRRTRLRYLVDNGSVSDEFHRVTAEARFREGEGLPGRTWRTRDLVFVSDLGQVRDCSRAPAAQRAGIKTAVCFPIISGGTVIGAMDFMATEIIDLSQEWKEALRGIARMVSARFIRLEVEQQ